MRKTCEVLVYIDLARCLADGLPFVLSANEVILSTGNERGMQVGETQSTVL